MDFLGIYTYFAMVYFVNAGGGHHHTLRGDINMLLRIPPLWLLLRDGPCSEMQPQLRVASLWAPQWYGV